MEHDSIQCHNKITRVSVLAGVILAALLSFAGKSESLVLQPVIGLIYTVLLLGLSFIFQLGILLRLSLAFLTGIIVNQVMLNSFTFDLGQFNIAFFWHMPVLMLFLVGFYMLFRKNLNQIAGIGKEYLIVLGVLLFHMILLFVLLNQTFGFGYEYSQRVFINAIVFGAFLSGFTIILKDDTIYRGITVILSSYFFAAFYLK